MYISAKVMNLNANVRVHIGQELFRDVILKPSPQL